MADSIEIRTKEDAENTKTITFEVTITQEDADYLREPEQAHVKRAIEDLCEYGCVGVRDVQVTRKD